MEQSVVAAEKQSISKDEKIERNSSFELLRIIAMIMIIFSHFAVHGGFDFGVSELSVNHLWYYAMSMGGKIGVDIFVLISGYFLIDSKDTKFNLKKTLKLWGEMFFYSVLIYVIFVAFLGEPFGIKSLIKTVFPLIFGQWWFATTYVVLYILHPFINMFLKKISRKTYQTLIITMIILWCFIPTFTSRSMEGSNLTWFITLYSIAAYVRLYGFNTKFKWNHYLIFFLISIFVTYISSVVFTALAIKVEIFGEHATFFFGQNKLPAFASALSLFMLFSTFKMKNIKFINFISASTFGVYLLHDSNLIRPYLWTEIFKNASYQSSNLLMIYSIGACLLVFVSCIVIDIIRRLTIEKLWLLLVDKFLKYVLIPINWIINFIFGWLFGKDEIEDISKDGFSKE